MQSQLTHAHDHAIRHDDQAERLQLQMELETLFHKNQLIPRIQAEFLSCDSFDFVGYLNEKNIPEDFGISLLVQMVLHKRTSLPILVGILRKHFEPSPNASQLTANMLLKAAEADLINWDALTRQFIIQFNISNDVQAELDRYQFPLPMVIEPRSVTTNRETGYLTSPVNTGSVILKKNHHNNDVCLDHLNRVNAVKFSIDTDTAFMIRNQWRNLDKPKEGETKFDYQRRVKSFDKYDRTSKDVIRKVLSLGNSFYLTHKYDKRGRVYCQGYHINYQGNAWNKSVVELYDKELVT
jgi:hypothetical protein